MSKFGVVLLGLLTLTLLLIFNQQFSGVLGKTTAFHYAMDASRLTDMVSSCPSSCEVTFTLPQRIQGEEYEIRKESTGEVEWIVIKSGGKTRRVPLLSRGVEFTTDGEKIKIKK